MIKLDSSEAITEESRNEFTRIIHQLIAELDNRPFELYPNFKESNEFSISISGLKNKPIRSYQINIDIGLFRMIYDVIYIVLSNDSFFNGIGRSSGLFKIPTIEVPNWTVLDLAMSNNDPVYFDEERKELHNYLYKLCLHFIIRHEIRHIANGHIDYLVNQTHQPFYENSGNGLNPIDSQTLEMDVDSCVFVGVLHGLLSIPEHKNHVPLKLRSIDGIFDSLFFALKILFYYLPSKKVSSLSEIERSYHPNSSLRYFFSFTAGLSYMQEKYPELVNKFGNTYKYSWSDFDALDKQGLLSYEKIIIDNEWSMSEEGFAYANRIWKHWNVWIPRLEPYTYLKLAPPEE